MGGIASADVIITEIMYAPNTTLEGTDTNLEWVELFNNGTSTVDLSSWQLEEKDFDDLNILPGEFIVVARQLIDSDGDFSSFEAYYGNNDSVWNLTDASYQAVDVNFSNALSNSGEIVNLSNGTETKFVVDYTPFISLANSNGKTLIFYKGNFTESAFVNGTPGATNDQFAPDFNKWINPAANNTPVKGLVNVTVNITDAAHRVNVSLINFNNSNFLMDNNGDIWYYVWNTSLNSDGMYNITVFSNDSVGLSVANTLLNLTVDNTPPTFSGIISSPDAVFNTLNVTISTVWNDATSVATVVFEHNATGTLRNFTATSLGSNNFSLIINSSILENQEVVGWKSYGTDSLGNTNNSMSIQTFVVNNRAPTLALDVQNVTWLEDTANSSINLSAHFTDNDGDTLIFNSTIPANINVSINQSTGVVKLTPANNFNGTNFINFTASDGISTTTSNQVTLVVLNVNDAPLLQAIGSLTAPINQLFFFDANATDADTGDTLTFSSNSSIFAISSSTGTISFTPNSSQVASYTIKIIVNDSSGAADSELISFAVSNIAPQITSFFPTENKTIALQVGSQRFSIAFTDADQGDSPIAMWFRNGTSIAPTNASNVTVGGLGIGTYNITVVVTDSASATARQEWVLNVTGSIGGDGLTSPVLSLNESERQSATNVTINQSTFGGIDFGSNVLNFSGVLSLEDAFSISKGLISVDSDTYPGLNKSASIVMKGLSFTKAPLIFTASGFNGTANNASCPSNLCTNITYDTTNKILRFSVVHFTTFFTQQNTTNGAPIIISTPVTTAATDDQYKYDVDATDPDGDTLAFSLVTAPSGMSINSGSGLITFTPTSLGNFSVTVNASDGNLSDLQSYNLIVTKGAKLRITDLDIKVGDNTDKNVQNNSRISKEAAPGDKLSFDLEISNFFTNDEDLEIEDIDVEITIEDIDDGDDLGGDASEFDLKSGKDDNVKIDFEVPVDVDEDTFDVFIEVEGQDENGTTHEILWRLQLEVEKENHEIRVLRASATPSEIKCQRAVSINTEIINTGAEDEDDVTLEILSQQLGINSVTDDIELDEGTNDNRFTKLLTATVSNDVASGTYPLSVNTYYDGKLSDTETISLVAQQCELTEEVKETVKEKPKVEVKTPQPGVEKQPEQPIEISFVDTDAYYLLLSIMIVIFIGTAAFIVGTAFIVLRK